MDGIVEKYLPEAFAFVYVINSENAGGIQPDRVMHSHCKNALQKLYNFFKTSTLNMYKSILTVQNFSSNVLKEGT